MVTLVDILDTVEGYIQDPATWISSSDKCRTELRQMIDNYVQQTLQQANGSNSLLPEAAQQKAVEIYARMTSYANYQQMNGVDKDWILKCIADGLLSVGGNLFQMPIYN